MIADTSANGEAKRRYELEMAEVSGKPAARVNVILPILWQHAEDAGLLWRRRDRAIVEPHYRLADLANLDGRLEAHLDGLRLAEKSARDSAWTICEQELCGNELGEVFPAAVLAFESGEDARIARVLEVGGPSRELSRPLVSALGWLPGGDAVGCIHAFLRSEDVVHRTIAVAAAAARRQDPEEKLAAAVEHADARLRSRAARAAGELGRADLLSALREQIADEEHSDTFWAAWSVGLIAGDGAAVERLCSAVQPVKAESGAALDMALRRMEAADARAWIGRLGRAAELTRWALTGAGVLGDPGLVPWLLEHAPVPALARISGEAFSMITGVDLAHQNLEAEWPAGFEAGPNDDPDDENVELDPDENLPWPDGQKVKDWWMRHRSEFQPGVRYLCGRPMTEDWLEHVLRYGYQRQRAAAALELAIRRPGTPLFNVKAPGYRQQQRLGLR